MYWKTVVFDIKLSTREKVQRALLFIFQIACQNLPKAWQKFVWVTCPMRWVCNKFVRHERIIIKIVKHTYGIANSFLLLVGLQNSFLLVQHACFWIFLHYLLMRIDIINLFCNTSDTWYHPISLDYHKKWNSFYSNAAFYSNSTFISKLIFALRWTASSFNNFPVWVVKYEKCSSYR